MLTGACRKSNPFGEWSWWWCGRVWIGMGADRCMKARIYWAAAEIFLFQSNGLGWLGVVRGLGGDGGEGRPGIAWNGMPAYVTSCLRGEEGAKAATVTTNSEEGTKMPGATSQITPGSRGWFFGSVVADY
ncbi:hypothetical protein V495_04351 [Pseudogymnoascus sp. VKM F-4514 (FW-929)]|nr:hypothetical protein V495_04351 [Pseudogymnoascus sp. VKM F-4514 (FW-929)]KFY57676.1 hypothetical protein V497_05366 [Pseudogymnoascus sp. VKM F-4516 (FW-969)]